MVEPISLISLIVSSLLAGVYSFIKGKKKLKKSSCMSKCELQTSENKKSGISISINQSIKDLNSILTKINENLENSKEKLSPDEIQDLKNTVEKIYSNASDSDSDSK